MNVTIIRTTGASEEHAVRGMSAIRKLIGANTLDAVNLKDGRVMLVDEDDVWEWVDKERHRQTTTFSSPS